MSSPAGWYAQPDGEKLYWDGHKYSAAWAEGGVGRCRAQKLTVHGRHRNKALAAARRVRAVELKAAGYTYSQVANELGYTSRGTAYNIVA
jgi:hypothetical protein